jgi:hypothetical protein
MLYKVAILLNLQRISGVEVLETIFKHLSRIVLCWRDSAHPRKSPSMNRFYAGALSYAVLESFCATAMSRSRNNLYALAYVHRLLSPMYAALGHT